MLESNSATTCDSPCGDSVDADERQDLTYRYATPADFTRFYGQTQRMTARAVVILLNDEPVVMMGLAYGRDCATMFSDSKPKIEPFKRRMTVLRAIKMAMRLADTCGRDVYAVRQDGTDILPRLGFEHFDGDIYKWHSSRQRSRT
jgi:hypothetical protein